ncbi:MAG TPA: hypothetical protein VH478_26280 [Trebonia sp.]|jgi:hypothetical protein|nr:hypothetical protein [Trebonia sp.]
MTTAAGASFTEPGTAADARAGNLSGLTLDRPRVIVDVNLGITIAPADARFVQVMHNSYGTGRMAFFFEARVWTGDVTNCEPDKRQELRWFPLAALPEAAMVPCIRDAIARYAAGTVPALTRHGW